MNWIDVKDSLPEDYKEVLYCATFQRGNKEIMTGHREKGYWTHCCMFYSTMQLNDECEVTHWMELPEYPKPPMNLDEKTTEFAKRFIDENVDLLKRLADR